KETAKALIKLIEDQKLCQQMGQAGREFIFKNYDWGKNAQKMERLYISMLGSSKMTSGFGKR
ncbi:MAG: glycosyltransferase, partial [Desulfobacteraceae bacterium]|nr:glycosyltransferase [Desulfobacteraceae bacterium]